MSRDDMLKAITRSWDELHTFIGSLSEEQLTQPTDPAGWTVKDHIIHLAMWKEGSIAMLHGNSKREAMDIPGDVWSQGDDPINAVLQERYQDMPLKQVLANFQEIHDRMLKKLSLMSEEDLQLPYKHYFPETTYEQPIIQWVRMDTIEHYREHIPWMATIAEKA